ncbi:MAG: dockerin type I repeat-containing protein [Clostridia bacterium]|nr:dockerin type I repeat-containing protein [Clostridia bacterium]
MKRVISIILTVIMLAGVIIVPGVAASAEEIITGTLVTFGSYPQTSVIDPSLLAELNSQSLNWTYYDYYCDGKQDNYMKYADVSLAGERYRAVTFTHYRPFDFWRSSDYTFQDDSGYEPGKVYWFKFDPIVWRVLDANEGLLMAENLIDSQPFHYVHYTNYDKNNDSYSYYGDQSYTHYVSNWAYSSLRSWMNGDFYDTAFSAEKSYIKTTSLTMPSGYSSEYDADPTKDKVFLLSGADVLNPSYGFSSDDNSGADTNRIAYGTDYARCQGLGCVGSSTGFYWSDASYWYLRTPYKYYDTDIVLYDGYVFNDCLDYINFTYLGVRPALKVNLQSAISQSLIKITDSNNLVINGPSGTEIPEIGKTYAPGDVDSNGQILADDARLALRFSAKLEDLDENQQKAADVDGNNQVLADDARQILRFSAKLQQQFDKAA